MRVALLADVHANLPALEAVLRDLRGRGVEAVVHAGDIVGYNPFPNEVVDAFGAEGIASILGNHDRAVLTGDTAWFNAAAAAALRWTRERLAPGSWAYLRRLAPRATPLLGGRRALVVHGSPRDDDEYLFPPDVTEALVAGLGVDLLILGHTHVPFALRRGGVLVVNPGSVGQPRDGDPRAAWALLDTEGPGVLLRRVPYPVDRTATAIREAGLPPFLAARLPEGR